MGSSPLALVLQTVAQRVLPNGPTAEIEASLNDILANNGLDIDAPAWFLDFWSAILAGRRTGRIAFERHDSGRWDITNFLAELGALLPLGYDDYGEGITFDVEPLRVRAFISREGPGRAYTYEIEPT